MSPWTPPGQDPAEYAALVSGIPAWIDVPVRRWTVERITSPGSGLIRDSFLTAWDIAMRNDPAHSEQYATSRGGALWASLDSSQKLALVDFVLFLQRDEHNAEDGRKSLEMYLHAGGSEWRVGSRGGGAGLEKRVPQGVADAAETIMVTSGTAGTLLSEAWRNAYGRDPNPEEAYEKAIKAVEEAGAEVVLPKNPTATLGTMIATLRDQDDWRLPLGSSSASSAPLAMMKALWEGQESRHGGNGYRKPTPAEAESAVLLAVPIVQFFAAKLLSRKKPEL